MDMDPRAQMEREIAKGGATFDRANSGEASQEIYKPKELLPDVHEFLSGAFSNPSSAVD